MRASALGAVLLLAVSACSVNLEGAKCSDDQNCPKEQRCDTTMHKCVRCVSDDRCTAEGEFCASDHSSVLNCRINVGSCRYLASEESCAPAPKVCVSGENSAACGCPPAGTAAGRGCKEGDTNRCDTGGKDIIQCVRDDTTGCRVWQLASGASCTSQQLVCGGAPGAATCVCSTASGTLYVDPVAGSDVSAATGALAPAYCRFKKLGPALAAASAGTTVAMTGWTSGSGPVTFAGETLPLIVKSGVSLTGGDFADRYGVAVDQAGPNRTAIQLEQDAAVTGFTIQPSGDGTASSALHVNCSGTGSNQVSVTNLSLDGKGTRQTAGIDNLVHLDGPCSVEMTGIEARNAAKAGVHVASTGSATVKLASSRLEKNGDTGLHVRLGSPEITLSITKNEISQNEAFSQYGVGVAQKRRAGGVLFYGNRPKSLAFTGNAIRANKGDQILIYSGVNGWTLQGGNDSSACGNDSNVITCFDVGGVGLSQVSSGTVDARFNSWGGGAPPPTPGRDYFSDSPSIVNVVGTGNDFCPSVPCP